ncbi:MAG: M91 family zinc metallopeptidase [Pyrinomonadaceae bacterium]
MESVSGSTSASKSESATAVSQDNTSADAVDNKASAAAEQPDKAGLMSKVGELGTEGAAIRNRLESELPVNNAVPDLTTEASITRSNGKVVIDAGDGDDQIAVTEDPKTGELTVTVNGAERKFTGTDRENLVIRAGDGDDTINVGKDVDVRLTIEAGDGRDRVYVDEAVKTGQSIDGGAGNDTLIGGGGHDYINGSTGNDFIMGRTGNDVVYAGDGNDYVSGGDGDDYLEGGAGDDTVRGWAGNDDISGGRGDDKIYGGDGNDAIYAGEGKDSIQGQGGDNTIYSQSEDSINDQAGVRNTVVEVDMTKALGANVVVIGSDEFKERIEQDLDFLRSSPVGRQMLEGLGETKHTVTIREFDDQNGTAFPTNRRDTSFDTANQKPGISDDATFNINPDFYPAEHIPPIVVFYHEAAHAYDYTHGTLRTERYAGADRSDRGIKDAERVAVGQPIDHDKDPATPEILAPEHPEALTENALRAELNRPLRPRYTSF